MLDVLPLLRDVSSQLRRERVTHLRLRVVVLDLQLRAVVLRVLLRGDVLRGVLLLLMRRNVSQHLLLRVTSNRCMLRQLVLPALQCKPLPVLRRAIRLLHQVLLLRWERWSVIRQARSMLRSEALPLRIERLLLRQAVLTMPVR